MKLQELPGRPARLFHLSTILAITTDRNISYDTGNGRYDALRQAVGFITGERGPIMTEAVPRLLEECRPFVQQQHPDLPVECPIGGEGVTHADTDRWIAGIIRRLGEEHRLMVPIDPINHTTIDPLTEMRAWWPAEKLLPPIIVPDDPNERPYMLPE